MVNRKIIKYPDYVKRIQITGKDNYRNLLRIKFEDENGERENEFMAVCMNPSKANLEHSDDTVNKLIKNAYKQKYASIAILNTYSIYETDSKKLPSNKNLNSDPDKKKEFERNIEFVVDEILNLKGTLLLAFGKATRKYMYEAQLRVIDAAKQAISKNQIIVKKIKGHEYYHHPERCNFDFDQINEDKLEESKNYLWKQPKMNI